MIASKKIEFVVGQKWEFRGSCFQVISTRKVPGNFGLYELEMVTLQQWVATPWGWRKSYRRPVESSAASVRRYIRSGEMVEIDEPLVEVE